MRLWQSVKQYFSDAWQAWDRFWFSPSDPATLSLMRVLVGTMLVYTHAVWSFGLTAFFGPQGWLPIDVLQLDRERFPRYDWSLFFHIESPVLLWTVHIVALAVFVMFALGLFTRVTAWLAVFFTIMYAVRVTPGAYFGLDKINYFLTLYLAIGPCGARYSLDRLLRKRRGDSSDPAPSVSAGLATRLVQWHLAIIYFFSGLAKLEGLAWWTGEATWMSIANSEYRSLDVTFLAHHPGVMAFFTHATIFLELFYIALIWNRWLRPWLLIAAVGMHAFIALCLGMITFGLAMIFANLAFVSPRLVRKFCDPIARRITLALTGGEAG